MLEPVQLEGNQLYQDEFLCPEAVASRAVVGHRTSFLCSGLRFTTRSNSCLPSLLGAENKDMIQDTLEHLRVPFYLQQMP